MSFESNGLRPKARDEGLVVEQLGDELLIYDLKRDKAHSLNETAALVFDHCDGERDVAELAELVGADEEIVRAALGRLSEARLLEGANEWSRRQVLRRIGVAGAAAGLGLPVVKSIVAPTPAAAQTPPCVQEGGQCDPTGCTCFPEDNPPTNECVADPSTPCCPEAPICGINIE